MNLHILKEKLKSIRVYSLFLCGMGGGGGKREHRVIWEVGHFAYAQTRASLFS